MSHLDVISDNSNQNLQDVPQHILDLNHLKMLYLEGNQIELIPSEMFMKLPLLTWLDVRNNRLKEIPITIATHQNLQHFLVSGNRLEQLPNELGLVPKLQVLQVSDNPLIYPDVSIIAKGTKEILTYLRKQHDKSDDLLAIDEGDEEKEVNVVHPAVSAKKMNQKLSTSSTRPAFVARIKSASPNRQQPKIVHKLSKSNTKLSLNSSCHLVTTETIAKAQDHANFVHQLKHILAEQEHILQQERNLQALDRWRREKRAQRNGRGDVPVEKHVLQPPYGIMSPNDIICMTKRTANQNDSYNQYKRTEKMIDDLIGGLRKLQEATENRPVGTPRTELKVAEGQIKAISEMHRKLVNGTPTL